MGDAKGERIRFRPIHLLCTGPAILVLAVPYLLDGLRAPAFVSTVVGGSTIAFGLRTFRRVRYLALWSVAAVVFGAFAVGVLGAKLFGFW